MKLPIGRCGVVASVLLCAVSLFGISTTPALAREGGRTETPERKGYRPAARIELLADVEVKRAKVTLGEVARLDGDEKILGRLTHLPLGAAPPVGQVVHLSRDAVSRWIRARTGLTPAEIAWGGSRTSRLRRAVQSVPGERLVDRAGQALRSALVTDGLRVELHPMEKVRTAVVPEGRLEIKERPIPADAVLARRISVWMDVWVDGDLAASVKVPFEVSARGPAFVVRDGLVVGEVIPWSALAVEEVEWSGRHALPVDVKTTAALRPRRSLAPGDVVTQDRVEVAPAVGRGEWATLRTGKGFLAVETRVEVLEDGRSGQKVRVKMANATSPIVARVTGPGSLEVSQ